MSLLGVVRRAVARAFGPRALPVLVAAILLGIPAGAARVLCLGNACERAASTESRAPFCSLPDALRAAIAAGFYEGRSPDVMAVTGRTLVAGGTAFERSSSQPPWPSTELGAPARVPIVLSGRGIAPGGSLPAGTSLEDIAPTLARALDLHRPHPHVRSGEAVSGVTGGGRPRLLLQVIWKGVGTPELEADRSAWPALARLLDAGAGTLEAAVRSLPLDPAAAVATVGTGGLPSEHGIVGTLARNDFNGRLARSWGPGSPGSVIATLADHLDEKLDQDPVIGLVGTDPTDRGAIGGNWYPDGDRDLVALLGPRAHPSAVARTAVRLLRTERFGADPIPDVLAVVAAGPSVAALDRALERVVAQARRVSGGSVAIAVTATGSQELPGAPVVRAGEISRSVERAVPGAAPVVAAIGPGGVFIDQGALARLEISQDEVLEAILEVRGTDGQRIMADAFPGIAVSFGRYC